jgi:undecaprenyl diphosphate synthase
MQYNRVLTLMSKMNEKNIHHVAMILDGNRRWAKENGLLPIQGHRKGAETVDTLMSHIYGKGVHTITFWVFSTENWQREPSQVKGLLSLFIEWAERYLERALRDKIRIVHIGRRDRIPEKLSTLIVKYEEETKHFQDRLLNIALDYGGRDEVLRAVRRIQEKSVHAEDLSEENFNTYLDTADQPYPDPDIIIRTGGEQRMSGFMIWQSAYAEYFFVQKNLPDMTTKDIDDILEEYKERQRRFGK